LAQALDRFLVSPLLSLGELLLGLGDLLLELSDSLLRRRLLLLIHTKGLHHSLKKLIHVAVLSTSGLGRKRGEVTDWSQRSRGDRPTG